MEKKLLLPLVFILASCDSNVALFHTHVYDQMIIDNTYLVDGATCISGPTYYKSCKCGEKGSETFTLDIALEHDFHIVDETHATYFEKGSETYKCRNCDFSYTIETDKLVFPTTNYEIDNPSSFIDENEYMISGIIVDSSNMIIKTKEGLEIKLDVNSLNLNYDYNVNDFLVIYGAIDLDTNTMISNTLKQFNEEVIIENKAEYSLEIASFSSGTYSTGNYGNIRNSGYEFYYNRAYQNKFLSNKSYFYDSLPGLFKNIDGFKDIESLVITYKSNSSFNVGYSEELENYKYVRVEASSVSNTVTVPLYNADFFSIEAGDEDLTIEKLTINYISDEEVRFKQKLSGNNEQRLNASSFEGEKIAGVSKISYPIKVEYTNDSYNVLESKEYTYYTLDYVKEHPECISSAAMIDPIDVINYYIAFDEMPVNYTTSKNFKTLFNTFNTYTRQYSVYSRTSGYVNSIPFNGGSYIEFDIDLDGSYVSDTGKQNRGVGRVVMFVNGFKGEGYNNLAQSIFTDDHYKTFQEYLNDGTFSKRFNAEGTFNSYYHSEPKTYN